jgi:hypothetical protein
MMAKDIKKLAAQLTAMSLDEFLELKAILAGWGFYIGLIIAPNPPAKPEGVPTDGSGTIKA